MAAHAFDVVGYAATSGSATRSTRRHAGPPSGSASPSRAIFRQAVHYKGRNRDTAWFAITDADWPRDRGGYDAWLDPANFDDAGSSAQPLLGSSCGSRPVRAIVRSKREAPSGAGTAGP